MDRCSFHFGALFKCPLVGVTFMKSFKGGVCILTMFPVLTGVKPVCIVGLARNVVEDERLQKYGVCILFWIPIWRPYMRHFSSIISPISTSSPRFLPLIIQVCLLGRILIWPLRNGIRLDLKCRC